MKLFALLYALLAYAAFVGWFLYAIAFLNDWIPKSINSGEAAPLGEALAVNLGIVLLFAAQHTVMARSGFKRWWTRYVPAPIERSTFVLVAAVLLTVLLWQWRPLPGVVWSTDEPAAVWLLKGLSVVGALMVLFVTFLIDHWDLVGLRQAWAYFRGSPPAAPAFKERSLYCWVRHPMMTALLVWFWATPDLTQGRLLFNAAMTAYILVGISFEERGLLADLGEDYRRYRERVPALLPWPRRPGESQQPS